jgi:hypothetical protein
MIPAIPHMFVPVAEQVRRARVAQASNRRLWSARLRRAVIC